MCIMQKLLSCKIFAKRWKYGNEGDCNKLKLTVIFSVLVQNYIYFDLPISVKQACISMIAISIHHISLLNPVTDFMLGSKSCCTDIHLHFPFFWDLHISILPFIKHNSCFYYYHYIWYPNAHLFLLIHCVFFPLVVCTRLPRTCEPVIYLSHDVSLSVPVIFIFPA